MNKTSDGLPLPGDLSVISGRSDNAVRVYRKRQAEDADNNSIGLWVGDHASQRNTLEEMAADSKASGRIERIGVLRADENGCVVQTAVAVLQVSH